MNGIFFEHVGTFEKIADENKEYESENFDETVHVTIPCLQFEVGIVRSEKLKETESKLSVPKQSPKTTCFSFTTYLAFSLLSDK